MAQCLGRRGSVINGGRGDIQFSRVAGNRVHIKDSYYYIIFRSMPLMLTVLETGQF